MATSETQPRVSATVVLNARLRPMDRGDLFEDPLIEFLEGSDLAAVEGAGTALGEQGEISECDIALGLYKTDPESLNTLIEFIERLGAPKGSRLVISRPEGDEAEQIDIGWTEGLALYLNGTDLPDEVYESGDINALYNALSEAIQEFGAIFSYWDGPRETALYLYGASFERLQTAIEPVIQAYPLCQKCRIVQIA